MAMKADFPEIEEVARLRSSGGVRIKKGGQFIQEDRVIYADSTLFSIFTLPMLEGNPADALKTANSIVINERTAKKYFNRTDVVGQSLIFGNNTPYKITGVMKDTPPQSHFNFDLFISMSSLDESREDAWLSNNFNAYILLKPGADYKSLVPKFAASTQRHAGQQLQSVLIAILIASPLAWLAMRKWLQGFAYRQDMQWWVFALAGLVALLIAFITISFQSIKAALANPVNSLKSE